MNVGVLEAPDPFPIDIGPDQGAAAGGTPLNELRRRHDPPGRGVAMQVMRDGAVAIVRRLYADGLVQGIVGMGGGGGTSVVTAAMCALPLGVPKVCLTTMSAEMGRYIGTHDVTVIPAVVDLAGINRITEMMIHRAAGAICGMVELASPAASDPRPPGSDPRPLASDPRPLGRPMIAPAPSGTPPSASNAASPTCRSRALRPSPSMPPARVGGRWNS